MAASLSRLAFAPVASPGFEISRRMRGESIAASASAQQNHERHQLNLKLEPFSQSVIARGMNQVSLVDKAGQQLVDECTLMEGDEGYECWEAHWKFEDLKESNKAEVEKLVQESSGVSSLIRNLRFKDAAATTSVQFQQNHEEVTKAMPEKKEFPFVEPGSFPKTEEELAEEESALMPDSPFTRLLRRRGIMPSWFGA